MKAFTRKRDVIGRWLPGWARLVLGALIILLLAAWAEGMTVSGW